MYYKKFNLSMLSDEKITTEFSSVKVDEKNYVSVFKKYDFTYISTMHQSGNVIIVPYIYLHKITNDQVIDKIIKAVKATTSLSSNVKSFILELLKNKQVCYIDSKSFIPAVPLLYVNTNQPYLILNGISKAFVYLIDENIEVYDHTKVIKLFNLAYLMQSHFVDEFEYYILRNSEALDSLFELYNYLFLYKFGFTESKYNNHKDKIDPILLNFIYNAQYVPNAYTQIKSQMHNLSKYGYTYEPLTIIPTLSNLIKQLQNVGVNINLIAALNSLQKINFWMPILLANRLGLYTLYLFTYMHVLDLGFPRLMQIAPLSYFKKLVSKV